MTQKKIIEKKISKAQINLILLLYKKLKLVSKNNYRNLWLVVGMAAFGTPLGIAFGTVIDNMGLLGLGLSIGIIIGKTAGKTMYKKAFKEGSQLFLKIKR